MFSLHGVGVLEQRAFADRLERYAKASGHPRLVEFLSRHNDEQNDKFVLSDDEKEDQVTNVS